MNSKSYDVVIVGGAVIGSSIAYFLTANSDFTGTVLIIEMDSTYSKAATSLSASSIRHQFSNPVNVRISQFGTAFMREFAERMKTDRHVPDLAFRENGYLFLASTESQEKALRLNHQTQAACSADVVLLEREELKAAFPHLHVGDIRLASYGRSGEGWFSNTALMDGFRHKAMQQGADFRVGKVAGISCTDGKAASLSMADGARINCGELVNASGTRAADLAAMAGLSIPVEPRKRSIFVFQCSSSPQYTATVNNGKLPLMIDSSGVFCRPEGDCFIAGLSPEPDNAADPDDFEPNYEEFDKIWLKLASRSRNFEAIKMRNCWAGHYDYNTLDQNAIVGPHEQINNFYFANGFSGHGLQQSPAVGRGISELIIYGEFRSLDLSELGYERIARQLPFTENAVI